MDAKMRRGRAAFPYLANGSGELPKSPRLPVETEDEALALEWGCKVSTAHQRKLQALKDVVTVVLTKRKARALDSLAGYTQPLEDAMAAHPQDGARHREALSDAEEDVLQARFIENECEDTARPLLRKRAVMRAASLDHDREIAGRFGIQL